MGRRVVLDVEGQVAQWGGSPGVSQAPETTDALVLVADRGEAVHAWALTGPLPVLGVGLKVSSSVSGPCWLSSVFGLRCLDGQVVSPVDVPLVPVFWGAQFESALTHPVDQEMVEVGGPDFELSDRLADLGWVVKSATKPARLSSSFADGTQWEADHIAHLGPASWDVYSSGDSGLILEKVYDRFHGLQRARVLVDGELVGIWQAMAGDRVSRWGRARFGLPPGLPGRFRLTIDPLPGTPLWDVARYVVWELRGRATG
ncbi:MAG: hypothetical protein JSS65_04035 [Armatimonadetes bacterium]|nr:hypothetical protein [Armatimonadota bacterium]